MRLKGIFLTISSTGLFALGAALSGGIIAQTDPPGRSTVSVRAIYQDTERPVRRAAVQIFSEDLPRVSREGVTDGRGEFSFKNVRPVSIGSPSAFQDSRMGSLVTIIVTRS